MKVYNQISMFFMATTKIVAVCGIILLFNGCGIGYVYKDLLSEENSICEVLLIEQIKQDKEENKTKTVFVAFVDDAWKFSDPPDQCMESIRKQGWLVRKVSESGKTELGEVTDAVTGKPGIIYGAGVIRWLDPSEVDVVYGCYTASLAGRWIHATMKKREGRWTRGKIVKIINW